MAERVREARTQGGGATEPLTAYRAARDAHRTTLERVGAEIRRVEAGRLGSFLVAGIVGLLYADLPIGPEASLAVAGVAVALFVVLVVRHRRLRRVERRATVGEGLARLGEARLRRQWSEISAIHRDIGYVDLLFDRDVERDESHPYVEDLDLFGEASVRALLGPTPTPTGVSTLRSWLKAPAPVDVVTRRQSAVRSLAADFEGREALATEGLLAEQSSERDWATFRSWLEGEPPALPAWAVAFARALPPVTVTLFTLDVVVGLAVPAWTWVLPLVVQSAAAMRWSGRLGDYFGRATVGSTGLRRFHHLFEAWEEYHTENPRIRELQERLHGESPARASEEIRRLERWLDAADSRASMFHVVVSWTFLWDVHVARGLERWRSEVGEHVAEWFEALGELEALAALATLAYDHPSWAWPVFRDGPPGLEAEGLGHPLLAESVLRTSDVSLPPAGAFLLVTGSNMSGKSTLLRSLGLAAVLAQAGSVVCARRLSLTPLRTFTSMRIHDSLTEGVSLFMAELNRLKALVDAAVAGRPDGPALLYLIDEVLQGTNSHERRIAARRIVAHLLELHAVGAVTTHDLSLHEDPRLEEAATKVHFRETVGGGAGGAVLTFDYKLRPGLATSRNALKLLEIVGLGEADDD